MNALFGNLGTEGLEEAQDRLGGFRVRESGAYTGKIKLAYAGKAANSDSQSVTIHLVDSNGEYRETFWVTGKDKNNFYMKDGKKQALMGFTIVDDICMVTTNKPLSAQPAEEKVVNLYDYEQKKEVPTSVMMLVELLGKEVTLGIHKKLVNKQAKNATTGNYEDTADTREENAVDKVFHYPSNLTVVEAKRGIQKAEFHTKWVELNSGRTQDRRSIKDGAGGQNGRAGKPGTPPKAGDSAPKTASLFG